MKPTVEQILAAAPRFWSKVKKTPDCWLWMATSHYGYGAIRVGGRRVTSPIGAHRVSYILEHGLISEGASVLHRCDTTACVNPEHLYLGTQSQNMRDAYERKRRAPVRIGPQVSGERNGHARLSAHKVEAIRAKYAERSATPTQLAKCYGVAVQTIWHVIYRRTWRHVG